MSGLSKQVKQVSIGLYTYDGSSFTETTEPTPYDIWNLDARWRTDWVGGSASTRALSGRERMNRGGYRLDAIISMRNMTAAQGEAIRTLLNTIFIVPQAPKIVGISPDDSALNRVYCNVRSGAYGFRRELTINSSVFNIQLIGVLRVYEIPEKFKVL